jgi:hypothetical protein
MAPPAQGTLVLDNSDGAFNIDQPGALYRDLLRRNVIILFEHQNSKRNAAPPMVRKWPLLALRILNISLAPGRWGARRVVLTLGDWHSELMETTWDHPLTQYQYTGDATGQAFQSGVLPLPYPGYWWVLGAGKLGETTRLYSAGSYFIWFRGDTSLQWVGNNLDTSGQGTSLYAFIDEMCSAEMGGRFSFSCNTIYRLPLYVFYSRTALAQQYSSLTVDTIPASRFLTDETEYSASDDLCNELELTVYPRRAGAAGTELWRTDSAFSLPAGEMRQFTARYRDPDFPDGTCSATTLVQPVASLDYSANAAADGSGADRTADVRVAVENRTSAAEVRVSNSGSEPLYVTFLRLRGTPLTARTPQVLKAADAASVQAYGYHKRSLTVAGVDDMDLAQRYADSYVRRHAQPLNRYRRVQFDFPDDASDPLWRAAFVTGYNAIKIADSYLGGGDRLPPQWIAGERHVVDAQTRQWRTTWHLEDFSANAGWVLGDPDLSVLGVSTVLVF